ncbi:MAG: glycoside hydrolase family 88 protein [Clostridia bacterium]|nr:glycoside hydrolase family 88 protein [Clostridia bacterium]
MNTIIEQNKQWIDEVWQKVENKLSKVAVRSREKLPYTTDENGVHNTEYYHGCADWWTNGFWGGLLWLMYSETGKDVYKDCAIRSGELLDAALADYKKLHHDVGFMWHLTAGAKYALTGDESAYNTNLYAAATLASRFNIDGNFIRAWNGEGAIGWSIIDCLMNIPLLYWASKETGDPRFKKIAMRHADMAIRDHIRPDGSVNHIVEHDTETGEVVRVHGGQGCADDSCWSRGLAWAVYGSIISYIHTEKKEYLDAAIKTANYFIANCAQTDYKPLIDFRQPPEPVYYDSTAGVCTACGLLEIAKYVSESEARMYTQAAINILKAVDAEWANYDENIDYLVGMGSERYPTTKEQLKVVHMPIVYGDFFYVEALLKLKGNEFFIW